jgi:CheY-like chemotaxis protein
MNVFVSYQRADTLCVAHAIAYALKAAGHRSFIDTGSIGGGELYPQAIAQEISTAHVVMALIGTEFSVDRLYEPSSVVAFEWRRAQFHGVPVVSVLIDDAALPPDSEFPPELRWFTKRNAYRVRNLSMGPDIDALVAAVPLLARMPRRTARVLWVDDHPANNELERKLLRPHGIVFDNVVSIREATEQLANESYDLVITDLSRPHSSDKSRNAGANFLKHPVLRQGGPPVIVYAGSWAVARRKELIRDGATDVMQNREQLIETVLRLLGRSPEPGGGMSR